MESPCLENDSIPANTNRKIQNLTSPLSGPKKLGFSLTSCIHQEGHYWFLGGIGIMMSDNDSTQLIGLEGIIRFIRTHLLHLVVVVFLGLAEFVCGTWLPCKEDHL